MSTLKMDESGKIRPAAADLEAKWKKLADAADTPDAKGKINTAKEARLAFIVALFEAYNLAKSAKKVASHPDDKKAWVVLSAASFSMASSAIDIYTNVAKGALEDSALTFQKVKFLGAALGAAGTALSIISSWNEANAQGMKGHSRISTLNYAAALSTGIGGGFSLWSSLGYCENLFKRMEMRYDQNLIRGAAARSAVWIAGRGFVYRAVFTGASIAFTVIGLGIQVGVWWYSDKEVAIWIEGCAFGKNPEKNWTIEVQKEKLLEACSSQGVLT